MSISLYCIPETIMKSFILLSVLFLQIFSTFAAYDEKTAISLVYFAGASFVGPNDHNLQNITQQCFTKAYPTGNWKLNQAWNVGQCSSQKKDTCQGLIASNDELKMVVFAFRGTVGAEQLWNEAKGSLAEFVSFDVTLKNGTHTTLGRANKYFYNAMDSVWNTVSSYLTRFPGYTMMFTGHSLGGAIASLVSIRARAQGLIADESMVLYTYGEPRIGDYQLAQSMQTNPDCKITNKYRLVHFRGKTYNIPDIQ